jgi:phage shock protein PspC (stress-responsive transcriptional regulator)
MAFYCHQCGTSLPDGARFCSNCGAVLAPQAFMSSWPLLRPRVGRKIAGVCIAFSRSYGWDVAVVRILAVLALLCTSGLFGVAYVAAWIGIPEEPYGVIPPAA